MANEAGIEMILRAPDVKSTMDEVIEAWKEISKQEKEANRQLEEYQKNQAQLRLQMKAWSQENENIANALKGVKKAEEEKVEVTDKGVETQRKGILSLIRDYFAQKKELKEVEKQIERTNKELDKLYLRQRAIYLDARRGSATAKAEYVANNAQISKLNGSLGELGERQDGLSAKVQGTNNKFAGLTKGFNTVKAIGVASFVAIGAAIVTAIALMAALGRNNEASRQQFEKTQAAFAKSRKALGEAFAPVTVAIGRAFELIANSITAFVKENGDKIQKFAINVGSSIAGSIVFIRQLVVNIAHDFQQLGRYLDIGVKSIEAFYAVSRGNGARAAQLAAEIAEIQTAINADVRPENPFDAYKRVFDEFSDFLGKQDYTKTYVDIKKLREEFEKLYAELQKQLNDQAIKDAGPFGGLILKADIAAKEVEKMGVKLVDLARKLGKSQADIVKIQDSVKGLAESIRNEAFEEVLDAVIANIDESRGKLEQLLAKRAGGDAEASLALRTELESIFDKSKEESEKIRQAIEAEEKKGSGANKEFIEQLRSDLLTFQQLQQEITNVTTLDFFRKQAEQQLIDTKASLDKRIDAIKTSRDKLEAILNSDVSSETKAKVQIEFDVNSLDLKVAEEQLKQLEASIENFKENGTFLLVETEVVIRRRFEDVDSDIKDIKPGNITAPERKKSFADQFGKVLEDVSQVFNDAQLIVSPLLDIFAQAADAAIEAINRELEAVDELISRRRESVESLEDDLELEAKFKEQGLANDYAVLRDQLDSERALLAAEEQKRLDIQKKADEAEAKRIKIKQAQDTIAQASSLLTASTNIWQTFSVLGPLGVAGAVAAISAMFISFAASKLKAAQLTRAYKGSKRIGETFGELGPGEGYDDTPGPNRGLRVIDDRGEVRGVMGGDETLMKESVSKEHRSFLWDLNTNEDKYKGIDLLAFLKGVDKQDRVDMSTHHIDMSTVNEDYTKQAGEVKVILAGGKGITKKEMREAVAEAVEIQTRALVDYLESRPTYRPADLTGMVKENSKDSKTFNK